MRWVRSSGGSYWCHGVRRIFSGDKLPVSRKSSTAEPFSQMSLIFDPPHMRVVDEPVDVVPWPGLRIAFPDAADPLDEPRRRLLCLIFSSRVSTRCAEPSHVPWVAYRVVEQAVFELGGGLLVAPQEKEDLRQV